MNTPDPSAPIERLRELIEHRVVPLLERIATAVERQPASQNDPVRDLVQAIQNALLEERWADSQSLTSRLASEQPSHPDLPSLIERADRGRALAAAGLEAQIAAARQAQDPLAAIDLRDRLSPLLDPAAQAAFDHDLVRWLSSLVQRRLRSGTVRADVVTLAERVAESFAATIEGASLRASLPVLRRSAGLCGRCGEPYKGINAVCPTCAASLPPGT